MRESQTESIALSQHVETSAHPMQGSRRRLLLGLALSVLVQLLFGIEHAALHTLITKRQAQVFSLFSIMQGVALLACMPVLLWKFVSSRRRQRRRDCEAATNATTALDSLNNNTCDGIEEMRTRRSIISNLKTIRTQAEPESAEGEQTSQNHSIDITDRGKLGIKLLQLGTQIQGMKTRLVRHWLLLAYMFLFTVRSITRTFSSSIVTWDLVSFVTLVTPFVVYAVTRFLFYERLGSDDVVTILLMTLGGVLIAMGNRITPEDRTGFSWIIDVSLIWSAMHVREVAGIVIAFVSMLFLSGGIIVTRVSNLQYLEERPRLPHPSALHRRRIIQRYTRTDYDPLTLTVSVIATIFPIALFFSLVLGEDWSLLWEMSGAWWSVLVFLGVVVHLGAVVAEIFSIRILGASKASSVIAIRLLAGLLFTGVVTGQWLNNICELLGLVLVVLTCCWFLFKQDQAWRRYSNVRDVAIRVRSLDLEEGEPERKATFHASEA